MVSDETSSLSTFTYIDYSILTKGNIENWLFEPTNRNIAKFNLARISSLSHSNFAQFLFQKYKFNSETRGLASLLSRNDGWTVLLLDLSNLNTDVYKCSQVWYINFKLALCVFRATLLKCNSWFNKVPNTILIPA